MSGFEDNLLIEADNILKRGTCTEDKLVESLREEGVIDHVQFKSEQSPDD